MTEFFSIIILLAIAVSWLFIMKTNASFGEKAMLMLMAAVGGVIGGAIVGAILMIFPPFVVIVMVLTFFGGLVYVFGSIYLRTPKQKKQATSNNVKPEKKTNTSTEELLQMLSGIQEGKTISFGPYSWDVISVQANEALIYTQNVIMKKAYHKDTQAKGAIWANCTLRKYLNDRFLSTQFNQAEQSLILGRSIQNYQRSPYGKAVKTLDPTVDKVFPLSWDEFNKHVPKDKAKGMLNGKLCDFYLRDSYYSEACVVAMWGDDQQVAHRSSCCDYGIRVAMWIRIK